MRTGLGVIIACGALSLYCLANWPLTWLAVTGGSGVLLWAMCRKELRLSR